MIPEKNEAVVESTVGGEAVAMGIDEAAMAHIMSILTNIYSDPELAIIREYSTNGLDSHIAAGTARPIEVSTPTPLRPLLIIRDYGLGLSADDIRDIYSRYGASTKRGTNDAVGMLGIGCKSALAYTDQFTLCGVKDGKSITVSIARDEAGGGTMTVLDERETDEPNGVTVTIPAKRENELSAKAQGFFAAWAPGTVLLDGEAPEPLDGWSVGEDFLIREQEAYRGRGYYGGTVATSQRFKIIMGNVTYPAPDGYESEAVRSIPGKMELIARVPIGTVNFAPSREALLDHPSTRAALDQVLAGFQDACAAYVRDQVEGADSKPAAAKALVEARDALGEKNVETPKWNGLDVPAWVEVPTNFNMKTKERVEQETLWHALNTYRSSSYRTQLSKVRFDHAVSFVWILGFDNETWTSQMRRKLDRFLECEELAESAINRDILIYTGDEVPGADWLDGAALTVEWETVRKWKDPAKVAAATAAGGTLKYAGTYAAYRPDGTYTKTLKASDIDTEKPLHYVANGIYSHDAATMQSILGGTIIMLPSTRRAKFERLFPDAKPARPATQEAVTKWVKGLSKAVSEAIEIGPHLGSYKRVLTTMDPAEIKDGELSKLAAAARRWETKLEVQWRERSAWMRESDGRGQKRISSAMQKYPLLVASAREIRYNQVSADHLHTYVNAIHASE